MSRRLTKAEEQQTIQGLERVSVQCIRFLSSAPGIDAVLRPGVLGELVGQEIAAITKMAYVQGVFDALGVEDEDAAGRILCRDLDLEGT